MLTAQLAALQGRVAQLEAELAERLAQIEAFQPGIAAKAKAWVEQVDRPPRHR
ncbi:MAG: hypothetical protein ACJ8AW_44545 [Rhodopila sp.]